MACFLAPGNKDLILFVWWDCKVTKAFSLTITAQNFCQLLPLAIGKIEYVRFCLSSTAQADSTSSESRPCYLICTARV